MTPDDLKAQALTAPQTMLNVLGPFLLANQRLLTRERFERATAAGLQMLDRALADSRDADGSVGEVLTSFATGIVAVLLKTIEEIERADARDLSAQLALAQALVRVEKRAAGETVDE